MSTPGGTAGITGTAGTVLLTGAAGTIGTALRSSLPELGWRIRGFDRVPTPDGLVGDLADPAALDAAMQGVDAVVHLAGVPTEAPWPAIRAANVDGPVNLFEAARRADVRRVVFASSNHAVGFTPVPPPDGDPLPADLPARPDTFYGVSKAFGEALGSYYADRYGMQVACLRIGTFAAEPPTLRSLSTWLSPQDCTRLVDACLRSPRLHFATVWGVSANTRRTWDLSAGRALGYDPQDDAERFADRFTGVAPAPTDAAVGGDFTGADYDLDRFPDASRSST